MRDFDFYERDADASGYLYFMHFPDMRFANYNFSGSHIHESTEVVIVYGGRLRCTVNGETRELSAGEIFVVNGYNTHHYEYVDDASCYIVVLSKEYLDYVIEDGKEFKNFIRPSERQFKKTLKLLRETNFEFGNFNNLQKRGFVNSLFGLLQNEDILRDKKKSKNGQIFMDINEYISRNYKNPIRLEDIARYLCYNKNYVSTLFNETMGITFSEYINGYRLEKALRLAKEKKGKATTRWIAGECGFGSLETYYRTLRKHRETNRRNEMDREEKKIFKKKWAAIVGYGNRGQVYGGYSLSNPGEFGIAAVIDVNEFRLREAKKAYDLPDDRLFTSLKAFLSSGIECDFVINTTMDQYHYETAMEILDAGYDMLLEKPIVPSEEQLLVIRDKAREKNCKVFVCHVLRYTPFYREIKKIINSGEIGEIISMEMNEHVGNSHYLTSYLRGKWNCEEKCGSGLLLAKCCHDLDLMCWLNNATVPVEVYSEGARATYVKEKQPEGATKFCYECPHERTCIHSAIRQYIEWDVMPFLVWDSFNKPLEEITEEEKLEFLKRDVYGMCAYDIPEADLVDRQQVIVKFKNGSNCNFTLTAGCAKADRYIHIVGSRGEIEGKLEEHEFVVRTFNLKNLTNEERKVNVRNKVVLKAKFGGHYGGDYNIMHDLIACLNGDDGSISLTSINDSVNGHMCVYSAEKSRKSGNVVSLDLE